MLEAAGLGPVEVLKDVDYLATTFDTVPDQMQAILDRTGIPPEEVAGRVRSGTYRAYRRAWGAPPPARGAAAGEGGGTGSPPATRAGGWGGGAGAGRRAGRGRPPPFPGPPPAPR